LTNSKYISSFSACCLTFKGVCAGEGGGQNKKKFPTSRHLQVLYHQTSFQGSKVVWRVINILGGDAWCSKQLCSVQYTAWYSKNVHRVNSRFSC